MPFSRNQKGVDKVRNFKLFNNSNYLILDFRIIESTKECPMCNEEIDVNRLEAIEDLQAYINE